MCKHPHATGWAERAGPTRTIVSHEDMGLPRESNYLYPATCSPEYITPTIPQPPAHVTPQTNLLSAYRLSTALLQRQTCIANQITWQSCCHYEMIPSLYGDAYGMHVLAQSPMHDIMPLAHGEHPVTCDLDLMQVELPFEAGCANRHNV
jgi:hypothetical protein